MQVIQQPVELDGVTGTTTVYDYGKGLRLVAAYKVANGRIVVSKNSVRLEFANPELVIPQFELNIKYATELLQMFRKLEVDYLDNKYNQVFYDFVNSCELYKYLEGVAAVDPNVKKLFKVLLLGPLGQAVEFRLAVNSRDMQRVERSMTALGYLVHPYFAATKADGKNSFYNITHLPSGFKLKFSNLTWAKCLAAVSEVSSLDIDFSKGFSKIMNEDTAFLTFNEIKLLGEFCGELNEKLGKKRN